MRFEHPSITRKTCITGKTGMGTESGYKKLIVWQEAKKLVVLVYQITSLFPRTEDYALKDQMRRAVVSVLSQISEG